MSVTSKQPRIQIQFKNIVSACCYLQYKQQSDDNIDIQEVFKICKILGIKPGKALDYLNRWSTKLEQSNYDESFNIIRFSKELK